MLNTVILHGRLTKDIEIRYTQSNKAVASFTIAVDRMKEGTDFINCQAWDKTAETMSKFLAKGSEIVVNGRIQTRAWEDNEGKKRYATEVVVNTFDFCGSKKDNGNSSNGDSIDNFIPVDIDSTDDLPF